jgi:hypothetical protein
MIYHQKNHWCPCMKCIFLFVFLNPKPEMQNENHVCNFLTLTMLLQQTWTLWWGLTDIGFSRVSFLQVNSKLEIWESLGVPTLISGTSMLEPITRHSQRPLHRWGWELKILMVHSSSQIQTLKKDVDSPTHYMKMWFLHNLSFGLKTCAIMSAWPEYSPVHHPLDTHYYSVVDEPQLN